MFPITLVFFYTFAPDFYGELWTNGHCCVYTSLTIVFHLVTNVIMALVAVHKSVCPQKLLAGESLCIGIVQLVYLLLFIIFKF